MIQRVFAAAVMLLIVASSAIAQGVTLPGVMRVKLDNGVVLLLNEKHDVPLIGMSAVLAGGAVTDPEGLNGLASLLASLLEKGAGERSALQFAEAVDSVGGALSASGDLESINIRGEFMARDADLMIELLADMLQRPALSAEEMNKLRERSINFIRSAKDSNLSALLPVYGAAFLFGEHPYGNPVGGSEATLAEITHADIKAYYDEYVGADRLIIAVSGDFDTAEMQEKLTSAFAGWRAAKGPLPEIAALSPQSGRRVLLVDTPGATQTYFLMANIGVASNYPRRAALNVANTLFGGRFTSMLNTALRVESGLTYGARSRLLRHTASGAIAITSFTRSDTTVEAIDMALGVLGQLREGAITEEALDSGKNYILGQYPTGFETALQLAGMFAFLESNGLGHDYVDGYGEAITNSNLEAISEVIDEIYPAADDLVFVILGDASLIRDQVASYGTATELAISEPRFRP